MNNKYNLGERVYFRDVEWWVGGVLSTFGYDTIDWEYVLYRPVYGSVSEYEEFPTGSKLTLTNARAKEYELLSREQHKEQIRANLTAKRDIFEQNLQQLEDQLRALD